MKEILLLHPVGQTLACACGLFNLATGLTRKMFHIALHINCGALYYFTTLLGAGLGALAAKWAEKNGTAVHMELHENIALLLSALLAMGATTGLIMMAKREKRAVLLKYHRWINILSVIVYAMQGLTGFLSLGHML